MDGSASSAAKRELERMDAFLVDTDKAGRMPSYSKVAVCAIVGKEEGAHCVSSQAYQSLYGVGWTIPAMATCYWVGEAKGDVDFKDLKGTPRVVTKTAR